MPENQRRRCTEPDCNSEASPPDGYDTCDTCAWEALLAREKAQMQERIDQLERQLADLQAAEADRASIEAGIADPDLTCGERNAMRAHRALRRLPGAAISAAEGPTGRQPHRSPDLAQRVIDALTDQLHLAEGVGTSAHEAVYRAWRAWGAQVAAEEDETERRGGLVLVRCPYCGERVDQTKRWFEPCYSCRPVFGRQGDRLPDEPAEANFHRAMWAEIAADGFAAGTGQSGPLLEAGPAEREEVLRDLQCNLRHLADVYELDADRIATDARAVWSEECAEAGDESAE